MSTPAIFHRHLGRLALAVLVFIAATCVSIPSSGAAPSTSIIHWVWNHPTPHLPILGALWQTNGKKTVAGPSGLHTVWAALGRVFYATSADGVTWSAPVLVDNTDAFNPAIAMASDGTIGVLYLRHGVGLQLVGEVYYRSKSPTGVWSAPFKVTSDVQSQYGTTPSIVAHQTTMHMTWSAISPANTPCFTSMSRVVYLSFPANQSSAIASAVELTDTNPMWPGATCETVNVLYPSIAVSYDAAGTGAVVRIAFYKVRQHDPQMGAPTPDRFDWYVAEKPAAASGNWPIVMTGGAVPIYSKSSKAFALSLAANAGTGDFYLVTSHVLNDVGTTTLHYENAKLPGDTWRSQVIVARPTVIDAATGTSGCAPAIRIVYAEVTLGVDDYGPTYYRTGRWTGAATAAPTWIEATPVALHSLARAGTAVLWDKGVGAMTRQVYAIVEAFVTGQWYPRSIVVAHETVNPSAACAEPGKQN